jgi:hypothetical protein
MEINNNLHFQSVLDDFINLTKKTDFSVLSKEEVKKIFKELRNELEKVKYISPEEYYQVFRLYKKACKFESKPSAEKQLAHLRNQLSDLWAPFLVDRIDLIQSKYNPKYEKLIVQILHKNLPF